MAYSEFGDTDLIKHDPSIESDTRGVLRSDEAYREKSVCAIRETQCVNRSRL